jgi:long-chain acyl-CoA synthetase
VIIPRYNPDEVLNALGRERITIFAGGPAPIYMGLLDNPLIDTIDFSSLKYSLSGGAPCPEDLHLMWKEKTGCDLFEGWGMSEGAPICLSPADGVRKLMSVGPPVPETEIRAVDIEHGTVLGSNKTGEIQVRGPQFTSGYRNNPEENALLFTDGWLNTGDVGYIDDEGYLFLVDRKKDMVITGGYNVYPREIDELLFHHPKIAEAAAIGKPDKRLGEVLVAFVVLKPGVSMEEAEFFSYCNENLVKYKRPVAVTFLDSLPRTGANKINKLALKAKII